MALTPEELERREAHFWERTAQYKDLGHDRLLAASFILDAAGRLEGPTLDLGTGMGLAARELARRGLDVESVDVNAEDQQVAAFLTKDPALAARIRFTLADGAALPFPDALFGCAVTLDVLHHLTDGVAVLKELARVVKPGGLVVLADFSPEGFALVSTVHASEGRTHPEGPATLDWARGFLAGWGLEEGWTREGHLHRVAGFRKRAEKSPRLSRAWIARVSSTPWISSPRTGWPTMGAGSSRPRNGWGWTWRWSWTPAPGSVSRPRKRSES
jgi:ubiquinone/menaquinone biosynthesis C-methylase UbiE